MTKEDFNKVWKDSTKEEILNQYYYDYTELKETIDKAIEYIEDHERNVYSAFGEEIVFGEMEGIKDLLNILQGEDK